MSDPAVPLTWIEVIDTAVKIGLGALIAGLTALWRDRLNHKKDVDKQAITIKRELIERISNEFETFWECYRKHFQAGFIYYRRAPNEKAFNDLKDTFESVENNTSHLSTAQSLLYLLGVEDLNNLISQFIKKTEEFSSKVLAMNEDKDWNELQSIHNDALAIRTNLYKELSSAFKSIGD